MTAQQKFASTATYALTLPVYDTTFHVQEHTGNVQIPWTTGDSGADPTSYASKFSTHLELALRNCQEINLGIQPRLVQVFGTANAQGFFEDGGFYRCAIVEIISGYDNAERGFYQDERDWGAIQFLAAGARYPLQKIQYAKQRIEAPGDCTGVAWYLDPDVFALITLEYPASDLTFDVNNTMFTIRGYSETGYF